MSRRRKKKRRGRKARRAAVEGSHSLAAGDASRGETPAAGKEPGAAGSDRPVELEQGPAAWPQVREALAQGRSRQALRLARALVEREPSVVAEGVLADAYCARARDLAATGMHVEYRSLLALAAERCPAARERLEELEAELDASGGQLQRLLVPLADPHLPPSRRQTIEQAIRRHLTDLPGLAGAEVLPPDHPLRAGAAALVRTLEAATSGPATDRELALPEVPRRSPLAPWKVVVRAIACFHRGEDEACRHHLRAVDPGSAVAPLVAALEDLLDWRGDQPPVKGTLAAVVYSGSADMRRRLEELDRALERGLPGPIRGAIRRAVSQCRKTRPELLTRLRQHVSIRTLLAGVPASMARPAMGGPSHKDAYFWRLYALAMESLPSLIHLLHALGNWEEFRRHAVHEGWFSPDGVEVSTLYQHMADLLRPIQAGDLAEARSEFLARFDGHASSYRDQPPEVRAAATKGGRLKPRECYFLHPARLLRRAATTGPPDPEVFQRWLQWEKERSGDHRRADAAAQEWHRVLPGDCRPLAHLVRSCAARGALKKALGYLQQAEGLGDPDPALRHTQVRLWAATALRHLKQGKPHLVDRDLEALEALPQVRSGDRPAFLAAVRWARAGLLGDSGEAEARGRETSELLGSELAATLVLTGLAGRCKLRGGRMPALPAGPALHEAGAVTRAAARGCALGEDLGLPLDLPAGWNEALSRELTLHQQYLDGPGLRVVTEAALRQGRTALAYTASGAGLALGGAEIAGFLLLRARSLPPVAWLRQEKCIAAVVALAREQQDLELLDRAVELTRHGRGAGARYHGRRDLHERDLQMDAGGVERVVAWELRREQYPRSPAHCEDDFVYHGTCTCDRCQKRRQELGLEPLEEESEPGGEEPWLDDGGDFTPAEPGEADMPGELTANFLQFLAEEEGQSLSELQAMVDRVRQNPGMATRIEEMLEQALEEQGFMDLDLDDEQWPPPPRKRRKKKKKKPRRRRRKR